jgi:hypothetical protein
MVDVVLRQLTQTPGLDERPVSVRDPEPPF